MENSFLDHNKNPKGKSERLKIFGALLIVLLFFTNIVTIIALLPSTSIEEKDLTKNKEITSETKNTSKVDQSKSKDSIVETDKSGILYTKSVTGLFQTKSNHLFRGIDNLIKINLQDIDWNSLKVSPSDFKINNQNELLIKPVTTGEVILKLTGNLNNGCEFQISSQFNIKDIPSPQGTIRGEFGSVRMSRSELEKTIVGAELVDFDLPIAVSGFKMKIPDLPTIEVKGSRMNAKAVSAIRRASRGDVVRIFDIKTYLLKDLSHNLKSNNQVIVEIIN